MSVQEIYIYVFRSSIGTDMIYHLILPSGIETWNPVFGAPYTVEPDLDVGHVSEPDIDSRPDCCNHNPPGVVLVYALDVDVGPLACFYDGPDRYRVPGGGHEVITV